MFTNEKLKSNRIDSQNGFYQRGHSYRTVSFEKAQQVWGYFVQGLRPKTKWRPQIPWPLLPPVLALVPLQNLPHRIYNGSAPYKMKIGLALSKMQFQSWHYTLQNHGCLCALGVCSQSALRKIDKITLNGDVSFTQSKLGFFLVCSMIFCL